MKVVAVARSLVQPEALPPYWSIARTRYAYVTPGTTLSSWYEVPAITSVDTEPNATYLACSQLSIGHRN